MESLRIIARGLRFPEGPLVMADGSVLVAEIRGGSIVRVGENGEVSDYAITGGGPNGIAFGPDGAIYVCNNGGNFYGEGFLALAPAPEYRGGSIQRIDPHSREASVLYDRCGDRKLSSPNDLVFDAYGGFYFTDYGKRKATHRDNGGLYYALADGSKIVEVVYPVLAPNGIGLSPDGLTLYVAETETARLWAFEIAEPGVIRKYPFPSPHGGRLICGLPGFQKFDSLAVQENGAICIGTLITGAITVVPADGGSPLQIKMPDVYPTNICFGGPDMKTAYVTLAETGTLAAMAWPKPGLRPNHSA